MGILEVLPVASMDGAPFTDYLNVTSPSEYGDDIKSRVLPVIEALGPFTETDGGVYRLLDEKMRPVRGTFKFGKRGKVVIVSASGGALKALRDNRMFGAYLAELASFPHRVSMLHATQDYLVPSPPSVIHAVKDAAFAEGLMLTRKRILRAHVNALLGANAHGAITGTVYLGNRANADVWAKVYDKQHERLSRGLSDPGPLVRVEVAVQSDVGATLRDAYDPYDLFFHFAGKSLVEVPVTCQGWVPNGEGYTLGPRSEVLPLDRLDRLLGYSLDLGSLVRIAVDAYGEKAGDVLSRLIRKKCDAALMSAAS